MRCYAKGRLMFNWLLHAVSVQFLRTRGRSLRICVNLILIKSAYKRLITSESGGICDPLCERSFARIHNGQEKGFWLVRAMRTMRMTISHRSLCIHCEVKFPHSPILQYALSSLTEKTMTKTIHFHWEKRFVLQ